MAGLAVAVPSAVASEPKAAAELRGSPSRRWTRLLATAEALVAETAAREAVCCPGRPSGGPIRTLETQPTVLLPPPAVGGSHPGSEIVTLSTSARALATATALPVAATLKGPVDRSRTS